MNIKRLRNSSSAFIIAAILVLVLAIDRASALNCYICAEGGLEEFGECKTSFPFNCDGYAKRFAPNDKIFCRTTRHKTFNGSFTVVKECIAESAHYATFPHKSQQLVAEECDVLELNGFEVAYCLCRDADLCNGAPIVDQFTDFENKHPELFDPIPASNEATGTSEDDIDSVGGGIDEEKSARGEKRPKGSFTQSSGQQEEGRRNKNEGEEREEEAEEEEFGIQQQKHRLPQQHLEIPLRWTNAPAVQNPFVAPQQQITATSTEGEEILRPAESPESAITQPLPFATTDEEEDRVEEATWPSAIGTTSKSSRTRGSGEALKRPENMAEPSTLASAGGFTNVGSAGTGIQVGLLPELQCMQCDETTNLPSGNAADCKHQTVVSCPDQSKQMAGIGRPLCMTRQVHSENGLSSISKQCVTEREILNEFRGQQAADLLNAAIRDELACLEQPGGNIPSQRICICSSAQCNRPSLGEQIAYGHALITQPGPEIHFGSVERTTPTSAGGGPSSTTTTTGNKFLLEVNSPAIQAEALNCAVCLDVELRDSKGDCRNARAQNCAQQLKNEKAYCLTRQTQNGKDSFIVEKSCVSKRQFYQQFPEELEKHSDKEVPLGCASTYDGFVNYCLCDGQMCNRNGIGQQAEGGGGGNANKLPTSISTSTTQSSPSQFDINEREFAESANAERPAFNGILPPNPFLDPNTRSLASGTKSTAAPNRAAPASGGGGWEQNDSNEMLLGTAKSTNRRPAPANLNATAISSSPSTARWSTTPSSQSTTTTTPPTTTITQQSSAMRERLEKWKKTNSGDGGNHQQHRAKDIFDEFAEEANSAAAAKSAIATASLALFNAAAIFLPLVWMQSHF